MRLSVETFQPNPKSENRNRPNAVQNVGSSAGMYKTAFRYFGGSGEANVVHIGTACGALILALAARRPGP
jgi:hypothetical protein